MPDANRCDLLSTIRNTDLPIEIKGQWHSNVWDAACDQLEDNYARNYRSEGRGIYLVLWSCAAIQSARRPRIWKA